MDIGHLLDGEATRACTQAWTDDWIRGDKERPPIGQGVYAIPCECTIFDAKWATEWVPGALSLFGEKLTGVDQPFGCRSTSGMCEPAPFCRSFLKPRVCPRTNHRFFLLLVVLNFNSACRIAATYHATCSTQ